jgi:hypothetical protein
MDVYVTAFEADDNDDAVRAALEQQCMVRVEDARRRIAVDPSVEQGRGDLSGGRCSDVLLFKDGVFIDVRMRALQLCELRVERTGDSPGTHKVRVTDDRRRFRAENDTTLAALDERVAGTHRTAATTSERDEQRHHRDPPHASSCFPVKFQPAIFTVGASVPPK